jgi:TPR repeat protein
MRSRNLFLHVVLLAVLAVQLAQGQTDDIAALKKKAEQGDASAQFNLGAMYSSGQGVPQDYKEAVIWYRKAAEQGYANAQALLGVVYGLGQGVPQDYVESHKWINLAAADEFKGTSKLRDACAALMTPEQIAEAQKLAREWKPKKARGK